MTTPDYVAIIGTDTAQHALIVAASAAADRIIIVEADSDRFVEATESSPRRAGKSTMMAEIKLIAATQDKIQYEIFDEMKEQDKLGWNRNRQRNLRHYPGRRWIDLRTMNK